MTDEEKRAETMAQHRGGGEFILPIKPTEEKKAVTLPVNRDTKKEK